MCSKYNSLFIQTSCITIHNNNYIQGTHCYKKKKHIHNCMRIIAYFKLTSLGFTTNLFSYLKRCPEIVQWGRG